MPNLLIGFTCRLAHHSVKRVSYAQKDITTVAALEGAAEAKTEAAARIEAQGMGCNHIYIGGQVVPLNA